MNAVLRETYEVGMEANTTIDTHIAYLRAGLDEVKQDIRRLTADSMAMPASLRDEIKQRHATLSAGQAALRDRFDAASKETNARIDNLATAFAELRGFHKTVVWVCGGIVTAVTLSLNIAKAVGWL